MTSDIFERIAAGDAASVRDLVSNDPTLLDLFGNAGVTPVMHALYLRQPVIAGELASLKPSLTIHEAAALGDVSQLSELLTEDSGLVDSLSPDGFPPLVLAAYFGRVGSVQILLTSGANPSLAATNVMKVTALHSLAAQPDRISGHKIARMLVERGAAVNMKQQGGFTALHEAAMNGDEPLVDLLLAAGADRTIACDDGRTPADLARDKGHARLASTLRK